MSSHIPPRRSDERLSRRGHLSQDFAHTNLLKPQGTPSYFQEFASGTSMWLDLFFSMLFQPEEYQLKRAVYGLNKPKSAAEDAHIAERTAAIEEATEMLNNMPAGPEKDELLRDLIGHFLNDTPIKQDTMLKPDMLAALKDDPAKLETLNEIRTQVDRYNLHAIEYGKIPLDSNLVANWLWETSGFVNGETLSGAGFGNVPLNALADYNTTVEGIHADPKVSIHAAINHLGRLTEETRNPYLALVVHKGGVSIDSNGDGDFDDAGDIKSITQKVADRLGIDVDDVDLAKHASQIKNEQAAIYNSTMANNSAFWGKDAIAESQKLTLEVLGEEAPHITETHDSLQKEPAPAALTP